MNPSLTSPSLEIPSRETLRSLLLEEAFGDLESLYTDLHTAYARREIQEHQLKAAYRAADCYRPELTTPLKAWVAAQPRSYPARLSLAYHLFAHTLQLRTMRLAKDIPEENMQALLQKRVEADLCFQQAIQLSPDASLAYAELIDLRTQRGERGWEEYHAGLRANSTSLAVRLAMLGNLRTEWGGTEIDQAEFLQRAEHEVLSKTERLQIEARYLYQLAHFQAHFLKDRSLARKTYRQSLSTHRDGCVLADLASWSSVFAKRRMLDEAIALSPENDHVRAMRAIGYLETFAPAAVHVKTIRECAEWGEPYATDILDLPVWLIRLRPLIRAIFRL